MFHARALMHAKAFPSAVHTSLQGFRFGLSRASSSATWRTAKSQSGRRSCGSLLTKQQRRSATRHRSLVACPSAGNCNHALRHLSACHRQVGRASFGAQRRETALPRSTSIRQNPSKSKQGSAVMQWPSIKPNAQFAVFSTPSPTCASLTGRSSGHQYLPASIGTLRATHSGAAYLGR
jgi:hypothetical protein